MTAQRVGLEVLARDRWECQIRGAELHDPGEGGRSRCGRGTWVVLGWVRASLRGACHPGSRVVAEVCCGYRPPASRASPGFVAVAEVVMAVPYEELDPAIRALVRVLNEDLRVVTDGSCGGHTQPTKGQAPYGQWWVTIRRPLDEYEWIEFELLAWIVRDAARAGDAVALEAIARPPFLHERGSTLRFALVGYGGVNPDDFAAWIAEVLRRVDTARQHT